MPRRSHGSLRRERDDDRRPPGSRTGNGGSTAAPLGGRETHQTRDGEFLVRNIPGAAARKAYRCPGCQQQIAIGTPHLVVWPAQDPSWIETAAESRRHWHQSCWSRKTKGGPGAP